MEVMTEGECEGNEAAHERDIRKERRTKNEFRY